MTYRRGSKGAEVQRLQARLTALGHYHGVLDGDFGGGTESAVRAFQRAAGLRVDGLVGVATWGRLFDGASIPSPEILARPLAFRTLALTGTFETGASVPECFACIAGDFDEQGLSLGALQWNLGQGTLQPLLQEMDRRHRAVVRDIFDDHHGVLVSMLASSRAEQLAWARSIQDPRHRLIEPWQGLFKTLGRTPEFHAIQDEAAGQLRQDAGALFTLYELTTERAFALMFDIRVQNGGISALVRAQIQREIAALPRGDDLDAHEIARLRIIANRRAEAANPRWVEDVRARKLTIANGEGTVHGRHYQLEEQYGIGLKPASP
jgi:hypothetical protein